MKRIISSLLTIALILGALLIPAAAFPAWNGDANGDGKIAATDAIAILRHIAKWEVELDPLADFDSDGKITARDAIAVLQYIAGYNNAPDSLLEAEYGVSEVSFEIPEPTPTETVSGAQFGFDTAAADNTAAWNAAIDYLKEHPGTTLEIEKGVYKMAPNKRVTFDGLSNCIVDGGGSTFLFAKRTFFGVTSSELLELRNFTVDWDYETAGYPTTSVVRIKARYDTDDPNYDKQEYEFITVDDASYALNHPWDSMIAMDPETLTVGVIGGSGDLFNVSEWHKEFELTAPNVVTATIKSDAPGTVGTLWLLRHYNYSAPAIQHSSGTNVTYKDITIHSGPGGGIYVNGPDSHHVRIDGITIGLNPENSDKYRMSTTADALNIKNTGGYLIVENCDIGYQGDDGLNIHTTPGMVEYVDTNELEIIVRNGNNFYVGCEVGFKSSSDFTEHDFTAKITEYEQLSSLAYGQIYRVVLDKEIPLDIDSGWIIYNKDNNGENYIIRNNYFHENRARALLLGSPNGLVEGNRIYKTQLQAIIISLDYGDQWIEGTGVNNLIIRNNVIEECNLIGTGADITIKNNTSFTETGLILGYSVSDVLIANNTFINPKQQIISARGVENLAFIGNVIKNTNPFVNIFDPDARYLHRGEIEFLGTVVKDATVAHNTWVPSEFNPEKLIVAGSAVTKNGFREFGNTIAEVKE